MSQLLMSQRDRVSILHDQARQLLESLIEERGRLEETLRESRRIDQFRSVTGASSLDNAIAATRRMIADLDAANRPRRPESPFARHNARHTDPVLIPRVLPRPAAVSL